MHRRLLIFANRIPLVKCSIMERSGTMTYNEQLIYVARCNAFSSYQASLSTEINIS